MNKFPVLWNNQVVGSIYLVEGTVSKMEELMKQKFESLENVPFVISATFKSDTDIQTMELLSIDIIEEKK